MSLQLRATLSGALLAPLLAALPAIAQTVSGTIVETGERIPIVAVEVTLLTSAGESLGQVASDTLGIFRIQAPAPGRYSLRLQRIGYAPQSTEEFDLGRGEVVTVEIAMSTQILELEPLEVVETRRATAPRLAQFYERAEVSRKAGRGRIYFREDLARINNVRSLYTLFPGRANCRMTVVVDDLPVPDARDLDFLADVKHVEGVEIYRSTHQIPPEFNHFRACALMLVWTRPQVGSPLTVRKVIAASAAVGLFILLMLR